MSGLLLLLNNATATITTISTITKKDYNNEKRLLIGTCNINSNVYNNHCEQ